MGNMFFPKREIVSAQRFLNRIDMQPELRCIIVAFVLASFAYLKSKGFRYIIIVLLPIIVVVYESMRETRGRRGGIVSPGTGNQRGKDKGEEQGGSERGCGIG